MEAKPKEQVLTYAAPLEEFFKVQSVKRDTNDAEKQVQETTSFLEQFTDPTGSEPAVQLLAKEIQEDTKAFIQDQKIETVTFQSDISLSKLQETVSETHQKISKERQATESQILSLLKPTKKLTPVQEVIYKNLKTVPQRLIGLYIDRKMHDVNQLLGLNLSDEQVKELENLIEKWMKASVSERTAMKALDQMQKMTSDSQIAPEEIQDLYQNLTAQRSFQADDKGPDKNYRELLVIEFSTGFILRANRSGNDRYHVERS